MESSTESKSSNQRSAIVTGGAGFIGSHVAEALLAAGYRVAIVDSFTDFYDRAAKEANVKPAIGRGATVLESDITDADAMARVFRVFRPDVVIHLAAWAGVRPSIQRPTLYTHVNVTGTQILLDEAVRTGVRKFVAASSSSVYGNNEKVPFAETDDVSRPISPYAATKVALEMICKTAAHLHDLPITTLRFFTVYGPRQRPDLAIQKFMTRIARGEPISVFGDGTMSRDFTYIADIVGGVMRAVDRCGEVERYRCYNLGSDRPISVLDLIRAIEETVGRKAQINNLPEQPGDVRQTWADLARSRAELGYSPHTPLAEGLRSQWQWNISSTQESRAFRPISAVDE